MGSPMFVREDVAELLHENSVDLNDVVTGQYDIENGSELSTPLTIRMTSTCR
jgi:hypothetical protein